MAGARISLFLLLAWVAHAWVDAPQRCAVCQSLLTGQFYWWEGPTFAGKQPICEPCSKIDVLCTVCKFPIRHPSHKLNDGRWLCDKDFASAIFSQAEALRIYEAAWRDVQGILSGVLPRANITVTLVDGVQLKKLNQTMPSEHDDLTMVGLTRTRVSSARQFQHQIYLIDGLIPARLAAVCAHEYTHTWLHENVPTTRGLDHNTVEGFCELVAYKLMTQRKEEIEKKIILANAYTRGQVNAFVQAEAEHQFHRVLNWVKTGVDEVLPRTNSTRALARQRQEPVVLPWPPPPPTPTIVPDTLVLKGISGTRYRRWILVNDCTLTKNEEGRVRVGTTNLLIRCVDIRERSAIIRVQGRRETQELFLN